MGLPYAFVKVWNSEGDGLIEGTRKLSTRESIDYFMQPGTMKGEFLGACLDSCKIGTMTTCRWPIGVRGFMGLIDKWREENCDDHALYHEKSIDEVYSNKFELPWINHDACPREKKHLGTILDCVGRIRCSHKTIEKVKPDFEFIWGPSWDFKSQMNVSEYSNSKPNAPDDDCDVEDWAEYGKEMERFNEVSEVDVVDVCYSIIRDSDSPLAFETILNRLNILPEKKTVYCHGDMIGECDRVNELSEADRGFWRDFGYCHGHLDKVEAVEFLFDGWEMAHYVAKWKEQGSDAPWFAKEVERWPARENLRICSGD